MRNHFHQRLLGRAPALRALHVLAILSLLLPTLLLTGHAILSRREHFQEAQERIDRTLAVVHQHSARVFEIIELLVSHTNELLRGMTDDDIRTSEADINERLVRFSHELAPVQDIWIIDSRGRPLATADIFPAPDIDLSDQDYITAQREHDAGAYVSGILTGHVENATVFQFSRRRPSPDGSFQGVVAVSVQRDYFQNYYSRVVAAGLNSVALVRSDGEVLGRFPEPNPQHTRYGPETAFAQSIQHSPERGSYTASGPFDGVQRMVAYERLPGYPLYVAVGLDTSTVRSAWLGSIAWSFAIGIPSAIGLFALTCLAIQHTRRESETLASLRGEIGRREAAEEALRHAQKMEAVARLTAGVAHDFNNLLMIVQGSTEALRRKFADASRAEAFLDAITTATQRGRSLTRQLLAFARRGAHHPVSFDLRQRGPALQEMLKHSTRGDIVTTVAVADDTWPIYADLDAFEVALINLAVNARDAMPEGGRLTISTMNVTLDEAHRGEAGLRGDFVAVTVKDTGSGISEEHLTKVFEPFFTTKPIGKGTGLGLSQVYGFAKQSGGSIAISSTPGQGTAITLYLPRAQGATVASPPAPTRLTGAGRVLLVEDNEGVARATEALLMGAGFTVQPVSGAEAALSLVREGAAFDVVLSDIVMPDMSGLDLASRIRTQCPALPVVLMTGYSEAHARGAAQGLKVLVKPFTEAELVTALRHVMNRKEPKSHGENNAVQRPM